MRSGSSSSFDDSYSLNQLSTFMGVFLPCITTIFGVVIYLRLGFLVGQAGLFGSFLILGTAFFISFLTVLSLAALVSSGEVNTGGLYDGVRKSVGPEFGAVIGILFYCAYVVGIANYAIGFAHALISQAGIKDSFNIFPWNPPGSWVETFVASMATTMCAIVGSRGVYVGSRVLFLIFIVIIISLVTSMFCLLVSTNDERSGHTAFNINTLKNNTSWDLSPFGKVKKTL
jgi:solute carrier family 12 (potassium/chloride transporters), member 9